jgi:hypothetical protein
MTRPPRYWLPRRRKMSETIAAAKKRAYVEVICEGAETRGEAARLAGTTTGWINRQLEEDEEFARAVAIADEDGRDIYYEGEAHPRENRI